MFRIYATITNLLRCGDSGNFLFKFYHRILKQITTKLYQQTLFYNYQEQPKIETEQMRGQNAKSNTHVKIIFDSKYFLQKSHTYFCATKIFFLFEFIFCVVICVFCRTLEKIHGFLLLHFQTLLGKLLKDFIYSIFNSGAENKTLGNH